jgi:hypothetical protein
LTRKDSEDAEVSSPLTTTTVNAMVFNTVEHRTQLQDFPSYIASGNVYNDYMWQSQKYGHLLMQKSTRQPPNIVMVGHVDVYHFNCGPLGTCFKLDVARLEKLKQQFHLGKPQDEPFAEDFSCAITVLEKFQSTTVKTKDRNSLVVKQYGEMMVRMMHCLFTKRVS